MTLPDRDELLARTDLVDLATEICGPAQGRGRGAHWHCPNPDHPDVHPSMSVYHAPTGQRWKCHACGEGGTAIDLLMISGSLSPGEAIRELARRTGLDSRWSSSRAPSPSPGRAAGSSPGGAAGSPPAEAAGYSSGRGAGSSPVWAADYLPGGAAGHSLGREAGSPPGGAPGRSRGRTADHSPGGPGASSPGRASGRPPPSPVAAVPNPAVDEFVTIAERLLWEPAGDAARRTLQRRGFPEPLLRVNRVGFDPGPAALPRARGLPRHSPGIVFPVLARGSDRAVYYQVRALSSRDAAVRKYDQPWALMAPNPKLVSIRLGRPPLSDLLAITEGVPDGFTAALAGLPTVAVLGVGHAGVDSADALARRILAEYPAPGYAVCFDPNAPGLEAGARLVERLAQHGGAVVRLLPPPGFADLNTWWQSNPRGVVSQLIGTAQWLGI